MVKTMNIFLDAATSRKPSTGRYGVFNQMLGNDQAFDEGYLAGSIATINKVLELIDESKRSEAVYLKKVALIEIGLIIRSRV